MSPAAAVNGDLMRERNAATISSEELAEWFAGGREALQQRRALEQRFFDDATFDDPLHSTQLSHKEFTEYTLAKATKFVSALREYQADKATKEKTKHKSDIDRMVELRLLMSGQLGSALFPQAFPLRLHFSMFLPTLLNQANDVQRAQWLEKAIATDGIIGTYAQTELGHGTYLRGLETRADYDSASEEFVLNTPTLTAYKWWPGGLGHTANMIIVMAQLYIKNKAYGLYPFLVRIRDAETHAPLPGVDVGEIGPKIGMNGVNNGYLGLKDVRIPRMQMLMRYATVDKDGTFKSLADPILTYGTMVLVRVMIVRDVTFGLLQAATIATRYSAVRHQSPIEPRQPEPPILDHLTQQAKILPQIAKGICFHLAANYVWRLYQQVNAKQSNSKRQGLAELHALSCCLKAVCSHDAAAGIEVLRKSCGGHGYLLSANFHTIYGHVTAACTYEGENTVLLLQTARFLVKNYVDGLKRKVLPKSVTYLRLPVRLKWANDMPTLVRALEITAAEKVRLAFEYQRAKQKQCNSQPLGSNLAGIKLTQAATAHGHAFLASIALEAYKNTRKQFTPALGKVMAQVYQLFVVDTFLANKGDIVLACNLNAKKLAEVEATYERLLADIRANAVALVDGFDFHDRVLSSTLGCYDGRVYERLMADARNSTLNQQPVISTFATHLKPFMQGKL